MTDDRGRLARSTHILRVLAGYGFEDLIISSGIGKYLPGYPKPPQTAVERTRRRAENLRLALEELGPTFIKFGQFMSSRPDLIPDEYFKELEKLQDRVPPFPHRDAFDIIRRELKQPLETLFARVTPKPAASASLAQIHTAWLQDGTEIVLKVQRPNIRQVIRLDISVMYGIARLLNAYSSWAQYYDFIKFVRDFEQVIYAELDFKKEGQNIERLARNLKYFEHIHLPKVYWTYSSGKVLALERIHGKRLTTAPLDARVSREHLAEEILEAYLKQIVEDGFFHGDPHLGNLLFEPDGRVALIDLGIVGHLDADMKFQVGQMLLGFANQEAEKVTAVLLKIGGTTNTTDIKALEQDVRSITTKYHFITAADLGVGQAIIELAKVAVEHRLRLPQSFNLLSKTLFYVDVVIKNLSPELDYMDFIRRSTQRVFANLWQSQYNIGRLTEAALESNRLLLDTPGRLNLLLDKLVRDEVTIKFEHEHLDGIVKTLHQSANRLSFAIVVGAIIVGSALIMRLQVGRTFLGYPILGIMGFLIAWLLGIYLLIRILRTERL